MRVAFCIVSRILVPDDDNLMLWLIGGAHVISSHLVFSGSLSRDFSAWPCFYWCDNFDGG